MRAIDADKLLKDIEAAFADISYCYSTVSEYSDNVKRLYSCVLRGKEICCDRIKAAPTLKGEYTTNEI